MDLWHRVQEFQQHQELHTGKGHSTKGIYFCLFLSSYLNPQARKSGETVHLHLKHNKKLNNQKININNKEMPITLTYGEEGYMTNFIDVSLTIIDKKYKVVSRQIR